jgi:KUP system potassium uptake protein
MSAGPGDPQSLTETAARSTRQRPTAHVEPEGRRLALLSFTALGVVFGDIGTSPLYAFREAFHPEHGVRPTIDAVHGVLSLIVWSLILIVSIKYIALVMRADNRGEGGILALLALVPRDRAVLVMCGLFGAALLYGDGVITPAISVLSAAEGLEVMAPGFGPYVVPSTVAILIALFALQKRGTARMGKLFGPITLLWFVAIALLGGAELVRQPSIVLAANPWYAARFLAADPGRALRSSSCPSWSRPSRRSPRTSGSTWSRYRLASIG